MYEQALRNIKVLDDFARFLTDKFRRSVDSLKGVVYAKMGKKVEIVKHIFLKNKIGSKDEHKDNCHFFLQLLSK